MLGRLSAFLLGYVELASTVLVDQGHFNVVWCEKVNLSTK